MKKVVTNKKTNKKSNKRTKKLTIDIYNNKGKVMYLVKANNFREQCNKESLNKFSLNVLSCSGNVQEYESLSTSTLSNISRNSFLLLNI